MTTLMVDDRFLPTWFQRNKQLREKESRRVKGVGLIDLFQIHLRFHFLFVFNFLHRPLLSTLMKLLKMTY